ncbi:MAG: hypothetical protein AAF331_10265 [Pseudomonadota bacterium]
MKLFAAAVPGAGMKARVNTKQPIESNPLKHQIQAIARLFLIVPELRVATPEISFSPLMCRADSSDLRLMTVGTAFPGFSISFESCTRPRAIEFGERVQVGVQHMHDTNIEISDVEYVADMLKAILWVKSDLEHVSQDTLDDLEVSLNVAEAALRRVAAEMRMPVNSR